MNITNKQGMMFSLMLMVVFILIILGATFIVLGINESRYAERQRRTYIAFHIAEAGIERALYDLRQDFINDLTSPSWADGDINAMAIGPDASFYAIPYGSTTLNGGSYAVQLQNITGFNESIWIRSTGSYGDANQMIRVYAKINRISVWDTAIFAGAGASGSIVNGNVNVRGSVHILGSGLTSTDYAIDLGGTAEIVGNNYNGLSASLLAKVPALPTVSVSGETVETLNAELRVKRGLVGLSGSATVGESNITGNAVKEKVDGVYVTDGFGGSQGSGSVYSDNGWSNAYDLGATVSFPSLSDPYALNPSITNLQHLESSGLVISNAADLTTLSNITPASSFNFDDGMGNSMSMDGSGNLTISGIVYINGGNLNMSKSGADTTVTYTGKGSVVITGDGSTTGNAQIDVNLVTNGNNSYPNNIISIMTPHRIGFNEANIDVMGLFYAEDTITVEKQTDIMGTVVSNYFDIGTNVPSIYQVPETMNNLPPGIIGQNSSWLMRIVAWQKI